VFTLFQASSKQKHNARQVLTLLAESSSGQLSVDELAETTKLSSVVYPLLSRLHKQGMVEPQWEQRIAGPKLHYQITLKGLEYLRPKTSNKNNPWAFAKPVLTKVKSWLDGVGSSQSK
jgi:DNA-binding PadR family transcriptional regulator